MPEHFHGDVPHGLRQNAREYSRNDDDGQQSEEL